MGDNVACSLPYSHTMSERRSHVDSSSMMDISDRHMTSALSNINTTDVTTDRHITMLDRHQPSDIHATTERHSNYIGRLPADINGASTDRRTTSNTTSYDDRIAIVDRSSVTSSDDATLGADAIATDTELTSEFGRKSPDQIDRSNMPPHLPPQQHQHHQQQQRQLHHQHQSSYADDGDDEECDEDDEDDDRLHVTSYDSAGNKMSPKYYHCRMCNKEFESKSDMQRHSKEMHRAEEKGHKCFKCMKTFPSSQQLAQHSLVHSNVRKYPCKYCDKSFKQLSHVQQHQRIHTGERPYRCSVEGCNKSFRQLSSLQQHLKGHSGPSSFKNYQVARSPTLATPVNKGREKVNTTLARPHDFTCQVCEKVCEDEIHFYRHIHQHHPDYWRVFSGGQPLADFINDDNYLKQEPDESTFYCQRCRMEFPNEFGYWKHLSLFHPPGDVSQPFAPDKFSSFLPQVTDPANPGRDLPLFACPICKKLFTKQSYLVRHIELKTDPDHRSALENLIEKSNSLNSDQSPHDYDADVARMTTSLSRNHGDANRFDRRLGFNFSAASMSSNEDQPIVVDDSEDKKDDGIRRRGPTPHDFYEPFSPDPKFPPRPVFNFFPPPPPPTTTTTSHDPPRAYNNAYEHRPMTQQPFEEASDPMKVVDYRKSASHDHYNNFYHDANAYARPNFPGILRLPYPGCSRQPDNDLFGFDQRRLCRPFHDSPGHHDKLESPHKRSFAAFR